MSTVVLPAAHAATYPADVAVLPAYDHRNRLTVAFRPLLAIPHMLFVGGIPTGFLFLLFAADDSSRVGLGSAAGALGSVAWVSAIVTWFAIVFTGRYPASLWYLNAYFLRWRVHLSAYTGLLRDEFPPFGDGNYPAHLALMEPRVARSRLTTAFRPILVLPHLGALFGLSMIWAVTTVIAWFSILFTGRCPRGIYDFGVGALRWTTRVEAYLLLLRDEYPPFSLS